MEQCDYIYADGLRFDSGGLFADVVCDDGVLRRLAVIRDGNGAARSGEIKLKDLAARSIGQETVDAFVVTSAGLAKVRLDPSQGLGRQGRGMSIEHMREVLQALPEDQRVALAETQIDTMPYGTKNDDEARDRLSVVLEVLPDGALGRAIAFKATNFLNFYDWKMAVEFKKNRPLDFAAIDAYATPVQGVLNDSAKQARESHLAVQILDPNNPAILTNDALFAAQFTFIKELTDQDLAYAIFHSTTNKLFQFTALGNIVDQPKLVHIVRTASDPEVRIHACVNLHDQVELKRMALSDKSPGVRLAAISNLNDQIALLEVTHGDYVLAVSLAALGRITNQSMLVSVVFNSKVESLCKAAVNQITDPFMLSEIALTDSVDPGLRQLAVRNLDDPAEIGRVALYSKNTAVQLSAIRRTDDQPLLKSLACRSQLTHETHNVMVSFTALMRLDNIAAVEDVAFDPDADLFVAAQARKILGRISDEKMYKIDALRHARTQTTDREKVMKLNADALKIADDMAIKIPFSYETKDALRDLQVLEKEADAASQASSMIEFWDEPTVQSRRQAAFRGDVTLLSDASVSDMRAANKERHTFDGDEFVKIQPNVNTTESVAQEVASINTKNDAYRHRELAGIADYHSGIILRSEVGSFDQPFIWDSVSAQRNLHTLESEVRELNDVIKQNANVSIVGVAPLKDISVREILEFISKTGDHPRQHVRQAADAGLASLKDFGLPYA